MKEGVDHTRRQDFMMWTVHGVELTILRDSSGSLL